MPDDIKQTIRDALGWTAIDSKAISDAKNVERIDAALAWLDAAPQPPQPDWSQAPEWAQWWAVDPSGYAFWHKEEPQLHENSNTLRI